MLVMDGREALLKSDDEDELIFDHTSLLNKEITFRDLSKKLYANGCKLQIARTINLCLSFFGLGLCFAIPTATLEDLKRSTGAGLDIRHIYTARYTGYLFGSIIGGFLFDRYNRQFLLFLSLLATSIGVIVMPFCSNVGSLMACTAITGITMGFLDTGGNVWCLDLWGRRSAPIMQTLHFCFGLGAFVAPLVAEPFLSPLYLNTSVGFEGNAATGNATHRISHISVLHIGARNLVTRGVRGEPDLSFDILADYGHYVYKRNATDNSSEVITFNNSSLTQLNTSTENVDELLNTTSSTTVTPARTFKPKPQFADGNQLKEKDKWDRPSNKLQSQLPNSTTTVTTSTVPLTTQKKSELVSFRNESEQSNSSNELIQDDKGNATYDNASQTATSVSDNTTTSVESGPLMKLSPTTTLSTETIKIASTITRDVNSTGTPPAVMQNAASKNQNGSGMQLNVTTSTSPTTSKGSPSTKDVPVTIPTTPKGPLSTVSIAPVKVDPIMKDVATNQTQDQSDKTSIQSVHSEGGKESVITLTVSTSSSKADDEDIHSSTTTGGSPALSESQNSSSTVSVVAPTVSSTTSTSSPTMSSTSVVSTTISSSISDASLSSSTTVVSPAIFKDSSENPNKNKDSKEQGSISEAVHDPMEADKDVPELPTDVSLTDTTTTNKQQQLRVSGMEQDLGLSPVANSNRLENISELKSSPSSILSQSPTSLLENETHKTSEQKFTPSSVLNQPQTSLSENETLKTPVQNTPPSSVLNQPQTSLSENETPKTSVQTSPPSSILNQSQTSRLENEILNKLTTESPGGLPNEKKPVEDLPTLHYQAKEHDLVTESNFKSNKNRVATSYKISTPASQITTLKTTTVIDSGVSDSKPPQQSVTAAVEQPKFVTLSGTLTKNEIYPAEVDRDIVTEKHHHEVGINRVKNSNDQDGDNFTEPDIGEENKGRALDALTDLFDALRKNRLGKFEIAYVILGLYVFIVAVVFLVFLCKNPREPRSRQLEELSKSREATRCFTYTMVCLLSLFLCLYVGIEVAVGEVLQTFASMETLRLSSASGYFLSYLFWGSFAISRFITIIISMKFSGFCILLTNLTICLVASIMLVAGADKIEALLWLGTVILGLGVGPLFPTAISWVERYVHVTNKTASVFILGAALGEIVIPIIINAFINQEPMVLMYVNIIVNALCFISFVILSILAFRHGEKYLKKPKRSLYRLANMDDAEDGTELITNSFSNTNGTETGVKQRYRKLCT